ncbi:MAG TPA: hypothetical protein VGZ47_02680, partial [Gemmataceae bacterium]|nr:hypothetical protein [Gemmataceae bacterium]
MVPEYRMVLSLSTVPAMLDRADLLLSLAGAQPATEMSIATEKTIAACASAMLAAALDQGTVTALATATAQAAAGIITEPQKGTFAWLS